MKSDLDHVLFKSAYLLCLVDALIFGYSTFSAVPYAGALSIGLRVGAATLILIKLVLDRHYSLGLLMWLIIGGMVLLVSYVKSGYSHVFYLLIICLGMRNVDKETVISLDFWGKIAVCILIVLCGLTGIIENYVTYRTNSSVLRYSIGFNHPNTVASLVLSLILEEAWMNQRHATGVYTIFIWITANRTAVLMMLVFPIVLFGIENHSEKKEQEHRGGFLPAALFPITAVFSYVVMVLCRSSNLFRMIDVALSNRFYNARVIMDAYGIPLLGQQVSLVSVKAARLNNSSIALLDVAYLRLLIQAGPLVLALLAILYGSVMYKAWRKNRQLLFLIGCFFIIFGLCESGFNNVFMNFTLLFAAKELFDTEEHMEEVTLCPEM